MEGSDVCFAPVLSIFEAPAHPHNVARKSYLEVDGIMQQAPAPRFSRTEAAISGGARIPGQDTLAVLKDYGFDQAEIEGLGASGAVQLYWSEYKQENTDLIWPMQMSMVCL